MRRLAVTLCLFLSAGLTAPAALAQDAAKPAGEAAAQDGLPTGEQLFAKHVAAIGGADAFKNDKSRVTKTEITVVGQATKGSVITSRIPPNRMYTIFDLPGLVTNETWCDGTSAWRRNSNSGTKKLEGNELVLTIRDSDFLGEADYKKRYKELKTLEKTTFAGRPAYSVKAVAPEGDDKTLYFDDEAGFLIGIKIKDSAGTETTTTLSDYKQFGKAKHPTKIVQKSLSGESIGTIVSLETDVPNMPSIDPPDEVKKVK